MLSDPSVRTTLLRKIVGLLITRCQSPNLKKNSILGIQKRRNCEVFCGRGLEDGYFIPEPESRSLSSFMMGVVERAGNSGFVMTFQSKYSCQTMSTAPGY
jgi:hypothetical protein